MRNLLVLAALMSHSAPPPTQRPAVIGYDGQTFSVRGDSFTSITALGLYVGDLMAKGAPCRITAAARVALTDPRLDAASKASADVILAYASKE